MTTNLPMGGCPAVDRKVGIIISGLEQWKDGIVSGATVKVEIIQHGQVIHSEVFSGKASAQFTRVVVIKATYGDLIAVHNRPDLPKLEVSAAFINDELVEELKIVVEKENDSARLATIISEQVRERLKREMQPGGLLHGR